MEQRRMTWAEIMEKYPDQNVGLVEVEWGINSSTVKTAIVKYSGDSLPKEELLLMAYKGDIVLEYTSPDTANQIGALII